MARRRTSKTKLLDIGLMVLAGGAGAYAGFKFGPMLPIPALPVIGNNGGSLVTGAAGGYLALSKKIKSPLIKSFGAGVAAAGGYNVISSFMGGGLNGLDMPMVTGISAQPMVTGQGYENYYDPNDNQ